ncbi:MAG: YbbR-like domain-containing protein [Lutibacter sp.]|uniref:YbbR-like domain-containing protein n=1 Tax=Lutibacter sp. TaxID=1925666 RepID=UPI00299CF500|nr:YbbR-like domain-containing protein [Lutibacter sp.]MDX1828312.1 YbbR-like domain-containing protein [Lutibacter sp.]
MKSNVKSSGFSNATKRKIKEFVIFLVLTSIIWLLMELSKTYTSTAVFRVEYKNLPANKLIQNKPAEALEVALKAPGFSLLRYKIWDNKVNLSLANLRKTKSKYVLLPNLQIAYLNSQLPSETEVIRVLTDTISLDLGINKTKKVSVVSSVDLNFKLGYGLTKALKISPDSVSITGPEKFIDSINQIEMVPIKLNDVNKNISVTAKLKLPSKSEHVLISAKNVKITGEVDKFTEGSFTIPVNIINKPKNLSVNTLPNEVEVVFQSGLANYSKINSKSVLIVYDFNQYKKDTLIQFLTPIIKQKSDLITSLKINPSRVQFFIQK